MISIIGLIAVLVLAILVGIGTLREKRENQRQHRAGDRSFRLHTHALDRDARAHYRGR